MKKQIKFYLAIILLVTGCSPRFNPQKDYIPSFHQGDFTCSEEKLNQAISKENPKEAVWLLLDRATIHFAQGKIDCAIADYNKAIEAIDFFSQVSSAERISQILISDSAEAYAGEDFEQILARVYFSLALLQKGDGSNAFALLRQAEDVQQKKREFYRQNSYTSHYQLIDNSFAKYLLATLSEKQGDFSNAEILYREAGIQAPQSKNNEATVLIISHHGSAPYKVTGTCPASQISMAALEVFLSANSKKLDLALSSLTGIPVPVLCQHVYSHPYPISTTINGQQKGLCPIYDITAVANEQLNQKMPVIAARGMARLILRRTAVGYAQNQDPNVGALMDVAMLFVNLNTSADTRSWSTLPARIDMARYDIPAGEHELLIENSCQTPLRKLIPLKLKSRDLCVINIFNIRPGTTSIQVPEHFINNQEISHEL